MSDAQSQAGPSSLVRPNEVIYCNICSYPPEYCSYGSRLSKCKKWLSGAHPDLYSKYYGNEAASASGDAAGQEGEEGGAAVDGVTDKVAGLSVDEAKDAAKKEAKAERKAAKEEALRLSSKVLIKRQERTKRKMITAIQGLELFNVDLKKASKLFANKFATGSSVSKNNQGDDEIVIQGDVAYEVEEMLLKKTGKEGDVFGGKIPGDNIDIVDIKRKKATEEQ